MTKFTRYNMHESYLAAQSIQTNVQSLNGDGERRKKKEKTRSKIKV